MDGIELQAYGQLLAQFWTPAINDLDPPYGGSLDNRLRFTFDILRGIRDRCGPDFFAAHPLSELRGWSDHALEAQGRLTHPLRYDAASDRYVETTWDEAFRGIAARLGNWG